MFDIKFLMRTLGVNAMHRGRNKDIGEICGKGRTMLEPVD